MGTMRTLACGPTNIGRRLASLGVLLASMTVILVAAPPAGASGTLYVLQPVKQITGGLRDTCAIKTNGTPVCWGDNSSGQASIPAGIGTVKQLAPGLVHTCAIKTNNLPICWGDNTYGQITLP